MSPPLQAYEVLSDASKRAEYDRTLAYERRPRYGGGGFARGSGGGGSGGGGFASGFRNRASSFWEEYERYY